MRLALALPVALCALVAAWPGGARAEAPPIAVPEAVGGPGWGGDIITREARKQIAAAFPLVESARFDAAAKKRGGNNRQAWTPAVLAQAGADVGARYVLQIVVTRKGWLYTARAFVVSTRSGDIQMDFRSDFYKPSAEAEDRGLRIGRRVVEKIRLLAEGTSRTSTATVALHKPPPPPPPEVTTPVEGTPPESGGGEGTNTTDYAAQFAAAFGEGEEGAEVDAVKAEGDWAWTIRGWLGTTTHGFLSPDLAKGTERALVKLGIRSTLQGTVGEALRVRVLPLVEADILNGRLHRVVLEEGFVELALSSVELRLGFDSLTWGAASTLNVVDVINARDFTEGVVDSPKIGQPMLAVRLLFGNHSFSLLYLTPFIEPNLPKPGTPFSPISGDGLNDQLTTFLGSKYEEWHPQAAARLALAFEGLDLRASYFYGYERFPMALLSAKALLYPLIHHVSTDGQVIIAGTTFKWELASVWHPENDRTRSPPVTLADGTGAASVPMPGQRFVYVVGVERTFENVLGGTRIVPVAEMIGTSDSVWFTDHRPPDDLTQFFQNHMIFGFRWDFENGVDSKVTATDLWDLSNPSDHLVSLQYSERWFGDFTFALGGRWGFAKDGHKMSSVRSLSGVFTSLQLNY